MSNRAQEAAEYLLRYVTSAEGRSAEDPRDLPKKFLEPCFKYMLSYIKTRVGNFEYMKRSGRHYSTGKEVDDRFLEKYVDPIDHRLSILSHFDLFSEEIEDFTQRLAEIRS